MDKHIQNKKEAVCPRHLLPFACNANYLAARWFNYACGANYPYPALKAGYFVFVWRVLT